MTSRFLFESALYGIKIDDILINAHFRRNILSVLLFTENKDAIGSHEIHKRSFQTAFESLEPEGI